jgi:hypothetical protein
MCSEFKNQGTHHTSFPDYLGKVINSKGGSNEVKRVGTLRL